MHRRNLGLRSRGMSTWDPSQHETPSRLYRPARLRRLLIGGIAAVIVSGLALYSFTILQDLL